MNTHLDLLVERVDGGGHAPGPEKLNRKLVLSRSLNSHYSWLGAAKRSSYETGLGGLRSNLVSLETQKYYTSGQVHCAQQFQSNVRNGRIRATYQRTHARKACGNHDGSSLCKMAGPRHTGELFQAAAIASFNLGKQQKMEWRVKCGRRKELENPREGCQLKGSLGFQVREFLFDHLRPCSSEPEWRNRNR